MVISSADPDYSHHGLFSPNGKSATETVLSPSPVRWSLVVGRRGMEEMSFPPSTSNQDSLVHECLFPAMC